MTSTLPNDNIRNFDDQITNKLISEIIRDRINNSGTRFNANDNISDFINPGELEILEIVLIKILLINRLIKFSKLEDNLLMEYLVLDQEKEGTQIFKE